MAKHVSIKRTETANYIRIRDDDDSRCKKIKDGINYNLRKLKGGR